MTIYSEFSMVIFHSFLLVYQRVSCLIQLIQDGIPVDSIQKTVTLPPEMRLRP